MSWWHKNDCVYPQTGPPEQSIQRYQLWKNICYYKEKKEDLNRTQLTVGGDRISYHGNCGTPSSDLLTLNIIFDVILLTTNDKFMALDIEVL